MSEHTCPTCGKELSSETGVRIHHGRVHGVHLPNATCKACGEEFFNQNDMRVYCDTCTRFRRNYVR